MKICKYCGTENFSTSNVCSKCQQALEREIPSTAQPTQNTQQSFPYPYYGQPQPVQNRHNLTKATKVLLWVYTGIYAFLLLICIALLTISLILLNEFNSTVEARALVLTCLIYLIVCLYCFTINICFTLVYSRKVAKKKPISTAFKVCTLLFTNFIAGILMLCDTDNY